jgi:fimbrial chaperone protein
MRSQLLGILAAAAAFGLPSPQAHAGTFSISPLRVELSSATQTGVLTIRNQEPTAVVVQADTRLWEQADGQERLSPTRDVLVSPAVFTIPANGSQIVRVALRRTPDAGRELSYRLILTEVPQPASPDSTGLSVALRLSLPVFVVPAAAAEPRLDWSATRGADGRIALAARNSGTAHARVLGFTVAPVGSDAGATAQNVAAYILPGQSRTWTLDNNQNEANSNTDWQRLRVKGRTEAGDFEVETRLEGG